MTDQPHGPQNLLPGGGAIGELMRALDWTKTAVGPIDSWPQSLRTAVSLCLDSRHPIALWWDEPRTMFYNDAYRPMLGESKHPQFLGGSGKECWAEIWSIIGPMMDQVIATGEATWSEDLLLLMRRSGYLEECYFTFSYSPIRDEDGQPRGIFDACAETTGRVLSDRRLRTLREMAVEARSADEAARLCAQILGHNPRDIPFALIYLFEAEDRLRLTAQCGLEPGTPASPLFVDTAGGDSQDWPLHRVAVQRKAEVVDDLAGRFTCLPKEPWDEASHEAMLIPIARPGTANSAGVLVLGISPRRAFDDDYQGFFKLVAQHVATAVANARAYEEERRRAEALTELDRAKTTFFSNVSHEFRTPLTLMLGTLEELLAKGDEPLETRELLTVTHRNSLRLLRLVNSLLDFSRIEAGRVQASCLPTDVGTLTRDLVGSFRSACEKAGLKLLVDCQSSPPLVNVDREMWEKIVLNLVSNAFKFTLAGEIEVKVHVTEGACELSVRDTGVGIPDAELSHVFDRFHRVESTRGRTLEGSGIGLSLVQELVKLHGGSVRVESVLGRGTTFTVRLPLGIASLAGDSIPAKPTSTSLGAAPFVEEALRWLPDADHPATLSIVPSDRNEAPSNTDFASNSSGSRILLADDNADMREYLCRLLSQRFEVEAAADGQAALQLARRRRPDLIVSDVMMPVLDGFGLVRELRADPRLRTIPVILLSARADEAGKTEGLIAGADDYVTKPFSARELMARVTTNLKLSRMREEVERAAGREQALKETDRRKDEFLAMLSHELRNPLAPISNGLFVLKRAVPGGDQARRALEVIGRQTLHLTRMVEDLLDVSRISQGKIHLQPEPIDLNHVVRAVAEDHRFLFDKNGVALAFRIGNEPLPMVGDSTRLAQVTANLLTNAAKFTPRGGKVVVSVEAESPEIAVIQVADDGEGLAEDVIERLFQPFVQADKTLDRSKGGLGLGLAMVKGLVELHGGTVTAQSEGAGKGSRITARLPRSERARHRLSVVRPWNGGAPAYRILVIDDGADAASSLKEALELNGFGAREARTGAGGIEMARAFRPNLVLCNMDLPDMNGYAVARAIRSDPNAANVFLVALMDYPQPNDAMKAREAGFDAHLSKPPTLEALEQLVKSVQPADTFSMRRRGTENVER